MHQSPKYPPQCPDPLCAACLHQLPRARAPPLSLPCARSLRQGPLCASCRLLSSDPHLSRQPCSQPRRLLRPRPQRRLAPRPLLLYHPRLSPHLLRTRLPLLQSLHTTPCTSWRRRPPICANQPSRDWTPSPPGPAQCAWATACSPPGRPAQRARCRLLPPLKLSHPRCRLPHPKPRSPHRRPRGRRLRLLPPFSVLFRPRAQESPKLRMHKLLPLLRLRRRPPASDLQQLRLVPHPGSSHPRPRLLARRLPLRRNQQMSRIPIQGMNQVQADPPQRRLPSACSPQLTRSRRRRASCRRSPRSNPLLNLL